MEINKTAKAVHENAKSNSFFDEPKNIGEMLCLIHSEVSEALECDRKDQYCKIDINTSKIMELKDADFKNDYIDFVKESFEAELADIMIMVMDLAASKGVDLEAHIAAKMRYNSLRPHKHGKKY